MTNINLSQSVQPKRVVSGKSSVIDKGTLISLVVLILTGLAVGGVKMYSQDIQDKIAAVGVSIASEEQKINSEDVMRIADFQNRRDKVEENINSKTRANDVLDKVNSALMTKSYITSFDYKSQSKAVALEVVSDGIKDVAKQTLNFKKSPYFNNVNAMGDYAENEKKKVAYNAELVLSPKELEAGK